MSVPRSCVPIVDIDENWDRPRYVGADKMCPAVLEADFEAHHSASWSFGVTYENINYDILTLTAKKAGTCTFSYGRKSYSAKKGKGTEITVTVTGGLAQIYTLEDAQQPWLHSQRGGWELDGWANDQ